MNPLATRIGVAYSDMRYRRVREFAERDHHGSMFVAQPLVRGRHLSTSPRSFSTKTGTCTNNEDRRMSRSCSPVWNGTPSRRRSKNALLA
ncbi:hypothetical protein LMA00_28500 [Burkholderia ambifaria]|uniref:hypothetical protein n=1 Tax=Burkholderia ambifaria TaxID=152480 RepID=UPI001E46419B|nr:hypothetical protein [Burkholderia ambifaria]UEP50928.1 hypothetical protein LMA00_28500 [Burkholderia ambifaria]